MNEIEKFFQNCKSIYARQLKELHYDEYCSVNLKLLQRNLNANSHPRYFQCNKLAKDNYETTEHKDHAKRLLKISKCHSNIISQRCPNITQTLP